MAAVVEIGSFRCRGGYSGDTACTIVAPTAAPHSLNQASPLPSLSHLLRCTNPVEPVWTLSELLGHDTVRSVAYLRQMLEQSLGVVNSPVALVLPELWHERRDVLSLLAQTLLEGGVASSVYMCRPGVCWSLGCGKPSALVLDCGHSYTTAAPVADAYVLRKALITVDSAGRAVSAALAAGLQAAGSTVPSLSFGDQQLLSDIKRACTAVATPGTEAPPCPSVFVAPDGRNIAIPATCMTSVYDGLFSSKDHSPAQLAVRSSRLADVEQRAAQTLITCGGTARAKGFSQRLLYELKKLDSTYFAQSSVHEAPDEHGAWRGASLITSSTSFAPLWITAGEFAEEGDSVLARKLLQ
jgi:actin-related protein